MENHPIPQDVTGFQFKLVGDMTLKQFGYLAAGIIIGWLFLSSPIFFLLRFTISLVIASLGFAFAFVPIEGRPMDMMVTYYIKALFLPNQFIYQKVGGLLMSQTPHKVAAQSQPKPTQSTDKLQAYLKHMNVGSHTAFDQKEGAYLQQIASAFQPTVQQAPQPVVRQPIKPAVQPLQHVAQIQPVIRPLAQLHATPPRPQSIALDTKQVAPTIMQHGPTIDPFANLPKKQQAPQLLTMQELQKSQPIAQPRIIQQQAAKPVSQQEPAKDIKKLTKEMEEAKLREAELIKQSANSDVMHKRTLDLEQQVNDMLRQKQQLEAQLLSLSRKMDTQKQQVYTPSQTDTKKETKNVRVVQAKAMTPKLGLIASNEPNLVAGIVTDPRGNILPNILVEVKDKEGNPVRAFKTNALGQFKSATALISGTYMIQFEDAQGKHKFDTISIVANGKPIPPLEVISVDAREELRRDLFGGK